MSQSCRARLFFGARLIQQNSSFLKLFLLACFFFFFQFVINLLVKIYMKKHNRHKTLCTTDFFNSVLWLVSCSSINQVPYFILKKVVTDPNLTRLLLRNKQTSNQTTLKKTAFRSGLPICHKL